MSVVLNCCTLICSLGQLKQEDFKLALGGKLELQTDQQRLAFFNTYMQANCRLECAWNRFLVRGGLENISRVGKHP